MQHERLICWQAQCVCVCGRICFLMKLWWNGVIAISGSDYNIKWSTKQSISSSDGIRLCYTRAMQCLSVGKSSDIYKGWPPFWLQIHTHPTWKHTSKCTHSDKLAGNKRWPSLPFPPPSKVAVPQKEFLCWLSLVQHSSAVQRHVAAGAPFTTTMSIYVSVTERCVVLSDWQRWRGGV